MTQSPKIAYMMSRFPKITETFVLYEMLAVMERGIAVEIYPLMREKTTVMHDEAIPLVERANFSPHISLAIVLANLRALVTQPLTYLRTLVTSLRATWGSRRFFVGILAFFPKSVYLGYHMQQAGITHLHAHFASFPAATAYIINQMTGIPYSFTAHGSDLHRDKHMLCEKIRDAKFVATISDYNRRAMIEYCNEKHAEKVRIIHCGVDVESFKPVQDSESAGILKIVCTGTLHEVKGQRYLIEACSHLQEKNIAFECHFLGDGPDEEMLKQLVADHHLEKQVIFHGRVPRTKVIDTLSKADVVVAPSVPTSDGRREGIPVALMEAMAFGLPVIASDLSGIPELITNGLDGILIAPKDTDGIAHALEQLADDPLHRETLGNSARQRIVDDFNLDENARLLSQLFE